MALADKKNVALPINRVTKRIALTSPAEPRNMTSLGELIVYKVNSDHPDYSMTIVDLSGTKHVILREVLRLTYPPSNDWGNPSNLRARITKAAEDPAHPNYQTCIDIKKHWNLSQKPALIKLDDALPATIILLEKLPPTGGIIKEVFAFTKARLNNNSIANAMEIDDDDDNDDVMDVNSLSAKFAEIRPGCKMRTTNETPPRVSAIDLVMVVGGQDRNTARMTITRKMPNCPTVE